MACMGSLNNQEAAHSVGCGQLSCTAPRRWTLSDEAAHAYSLLFMKPSRCSRLVNRLKMATNSVTVAMM